MSARAVFVITLAAVVLGACAKGRTEATDDQARTIAKMLEAAERDRDGGGASPQMREER